MSIFASILLKANMLRFFLLGCALLLFSSLAPVRPGPERTLVRLLKKPQIQDLFAGYNEVYVFSSACDLLECDRLPRKVKGKKLLVAQLEDLFMRAFPRTLYVDDVFEEDGNWGISFHIQEGQGTRAKVLYRGTYVR
jgi:hypothetical protein